MNMFHKNKHHTIFLVVFVLFAFFARVASALELEYPTVLGYKITENCRIGDYVSYFFRFAIVAGGVVALAWVIIAVVLYLVSSMKGDSGAIGDLKKRAITS